MRVDVKNYGAIGDGTTNDAAAIQSAINSGAGVVYFPKGNYLVNGVYLNLVSDQIICGEGTLQLLGSGIRGIDVSNVAIDGLILNTHTSTISTGRNLLDFSVSVGTVDNILIRNVTIEGDEKNGGGIILSGVTWAKIEGCRVLSCGSLTGGDCIHLQACTNVIIKDNYIYNASRHGIGLGSLCRFISIENNRIVQCMNRRKDMGSDGMIDSYGPDNYEISIVNNMIDTGTPAHIWTYKPEMIRMLGAHNVIIHGNQLLVQSSNIYYPILVGLRGTDYSDNVIISNNTFNVKVTCLSMIYSQGTNGLTIGGNNVFVKSDLAVNCTSFVLISTFACADLTISNNRIHGNSKMNYFLQNSVTGNGTFILTNNTAKDFDSYFYVGNFVTVNAMICSGNSFNTSYTEAFWVYPTIASLILSGNHFTITGNGSAIVNVHNGTTIAQVFGNLETNAGGTTTKNTVVGEVIYL